MQTTQSIFPTILSALQASDLSQKEKDELFIEFSEVVFNDSLYRILEQMDSATLLDFQNLLDQDASEAEIQEFIEKRVPNAQEAVQTTVQDLVDDILTVTS